MGISHQARDACRPFTHRFLAKFLMNGEKSAVYQNANPSTNTMIQKDREPREIVLHWLSENERGVTWLAKQLGRNRAYISEVVHGRRPLSKKLQRLMATKLGIKFPD